MSLNSFKQFYKQYPLVSAGLSLIGLNLLFGMTGNTLLAALGLLLLAVGLWQVLRQKRLTSLLSVWQSCLNHLFYSRLYLLFVILWVITYLFLLLTLEYRSAVTGSFANKISNYLAFGRYYSSVLQVDGLADHFEPAMFLFLPLFKLYNSLVWLLAFKLLSFLLAPVLLYKIGKAALPQGSSWVYFSPMLWMVHQYMSNTMLFDFQPSSLSASLILLAFYWLQKERYVLAWLPLVLALLLKEHMGLVWVSAGAYLWLFKDKRFLGASLAVIGIVYGLVVVGYVMPYLGEGVYRHAHRLDPLALPFRKIKLLVLAYCSVAVLPVLKPKTTLFVLPVFAVSLLTGKEAMVSFSYNYLDIVFPVLFVASILGLQAVQQPSHWWHSLADKKRQLLMVLVVWLAIANNLQFPQTGIRRNLHEVRQIPLFFELESYRSQLNPDYQIYATDHIGTYLSYLPKWQRWDYLKSRLEDCAPCTGEPFYVVLPKKAVWSLTAEELQLYQQLVNQLVGTGQLKLKIENSYVHIYQSIGLPLD